MRSRLVSWELIKATLVRVQSPYILCLVPEEPLSLNPAALSSTDSTPVASPQAEAVPVLPSTVAEMPIVENRKRRRSSCSSSEDEDEDEDSSSESETEQVPYQARPYSNNNNNKVQKWARYSDDSSSSDSDSESEDEERPSGAGTPASIIHESSYAYMHKRQMEETLLQKITQQLHQDKLPGILSILSSETSAGGQNSDEVEIDLSRLARDQLVRLLCYVEACIVEQNGGPAVNLSDYVAHSPQQQPAKRSRPAAAASIDSSDESDVEPQPRQRRRRRQRQGRGTTSGKKSRRLSQEDEDDDDEGPISMASLTKRTRRKAGGGRGKKSDDTAAVVSNSALDRIPRTDSIAVTRPKRRAALQKKNQFEDVASDIEGSDDGTLIVFGDEQMDFRVTDNKTIVHESSGSSNSNASAEPDIVSTTTTMTVVADDDDDEDEEIDIML